jgi:hypothetical protein
MVDRYTRLRPIMWRLNNEVLPGYLSKRAIEACAKRLGMWRQGALVLENEDEMAILMDYCLHAYCDEGDDTVERYVVDSRPSPNSEEYAVLKAMLESFHTLVRITEVLPRVGARVTDLWTDCEYLLIDMGFSHTAKKGAVLATRILPYGELVTTSGAALPVDDDTLREVGESILPRHGTHQGRRCTFRGGRRKAADLAAAIIRLCLSHKALQRIRYADLPPGI